MYLKAFKHTSFRKKLATILVLSSILGCLNLDAYASNYSQPIKLSKPANNTNLVSNTYIPFNLRSFNESDYFSSSAALTSQVIAC